jgi:hypothetical protein
MCLIKYNFMGQNRLISSAEIESLAKEPYLVSPTNDHTNGYNRWSGKTHTKLHHDTVVNQTYRVTGTMNTLKW